MTAERCIHGMDRRFCAVCNNVGAGRRPRGAIADTSIDEIVQFLNDEQVRATYGAVAEVLGVVPRSMRVLLGERRPEASWIVNATDGLPTGYRPDEMHHALFSRGDVISSGAQLALRLSVWKTRSRRDLHSRK